MVSDNFEKSSRDLEKEMLQFGAAVSAANEEVKTKCREDWVHTANSHLQQLTGQVSEHNKQAHQFIAEDLQRDKPTGELYLHYFIGASISWKSRVIVAP